MNAIPSLPRAVARALSQLDQPIRYKLGAGGRSPAALSPVTARDGVVGCDCAGFVAWCLEYDRFDCNFAYYDGWINTDSMIQDAKSGQTHFTISDRPIVGSLIVYPGVRKHGIRIRIGHVGLIVRAPEIWPDPDEWADLDRRERAACLRTVQVIDCASSLGRRIAGHAVGLTTADKAFNKPDMLFVEYRGTARGVLATPNLEK